MTGRPHLSFLLDQNVPNSVAEVLKARGHDVLLLRDIAPVDTPDPTVARLALLNGAILVSFDGDMKQIASDAGVAKSRFSKLNIIEMRCGEPHGAKRMGQAISLIEHEWDVADDKLGRRLFVKIGRETITTRR